MDEDLFERYRRTGDRDALALLFRRHQEPLYRFLVGFCGGTTLAEEAFQETFIRVIRGAEGYHTMTTFRAWLYTIARNTAHNLARSESNRRRNEERSEEARMGTENSPVISSEVRTILHQEVGALPTECRAP